MGELNSPFGKLPAEMKVHLFGYIGLEDKRNARQVCRGWSETLNDLLKFSGTLLDSNVKEIMNSDVTFLKLWVGKLCETALPCSSQRNNVLRDLKKLTLIEDHVGISEINLIKLFRLSTNVVKLTIHTSTLKNSGRLFPWDSFPFEHLLILKVKLFTYDRNHHNAVESLFRLTKFQKLCTFSFEFTNTSKHQSDRNRSVYPVRPFCRIYVSALKFIDKHRPTLTNLFICEPLNLELSNGDLKTELSNIVSTLDIKLMSVFFGIYDRSSPIWLLRSNLMNGNNSLRSLHLCGHPLPADFEDLVLRNKKTLEGLSWISDTILNTEPQPSFDMRNLEGSDKLIVLYMCTCNVFNLKVIPRCVRQLVWASPISLEDLLWLIRNLPNLEYLALENCFQLAIGFDLPIITVEILQQILASPKLTILNISSLGQGGMVSIENFCNTNPGLEFCRLGPFAHITIDRNIFVQAEISALSES